MHGGATSAAYFDCPGHPRLSLLRSAARTATRRSRSTAPATARRRSTTTRWPSPTGGSASPTAPWTRSSARVPAARAFPGAHSAGCELALRMAVDERRAPTCWASSWRAPDCATTPRRKAVISEATATSRPAGLRDLLWQPTELYPPEVLTGGLSAPGAPYEAEVTANWPRRDFPATRRQGHGAGRVQRGRSRARLGVDPGGARRHRRVVHVVTPRRRQRDARQRTQSQRRLHRRRIPPTGVVVRRRMRRRHEGSDEQESGKWRRVDARRIHRTGQPGRARWHDGSSRAVTT